MKVFEVDCEAGCPFRDEDLCHTGAPCFRDPPCAAYADDERDVEEIIDKILKWQIEEENHQDELAREQQIKEAKRVEAARKRRETNRAVWEERAAIKALRKRISGYEAALRFSSSMREISAMLNGPAQPNTKATEHETELMALIKKSEAEMAALEVRKKEKLKALRQKRRLGAKLRSIPEETPDKLDLAILADARQINDDTTADLEAVRGE